MLTNATIAKFINRFAIAPSSSSSNQLHTPNCWSNDGAGQLDRILGNPGTVQRAFD